MMMKRDAKNRSRKREAEKRERERERERAGPHAVQLPQGGGAYKGAVVPLEGAGSSFLFSLEQLVSPKTSLGLLWPSPCHFEAYSKTRASQAGAHHNTKTRTGMRRTEMRRP